MHVIPGLNNCALHKGTAFAESCNLPIVVIALHNLHPR